MSETIGLGDVVHKITQKLGIKDCEGCRRRRDFMNKFRIMKAKREAARK